MTEETSPTQLDRIEGKLDALLKALGEEDEQQPALSLDGQEAGNERDTSQEL